MKNYKLYMQKGSKSILAQMNRLVGEGNWKIVQMKFLFHILFHNHPMLEYESLYELFRSLNVLNNPSMHWSNTSGQAFVKFMHIQVQEVTIKANQIVRFIAILYDEVTMINSGLWILIHAYVVQSCYSTLSGMSCGWVGQ